MQAAPALPWEQGTGGTLTLREPITREQLLAGALKFTYRKESTGTEYVAGIVLDTQTNIIQVVELQSDSEQIVGINHMIQSFSGEVSSLQLLPVSGGEPSTLVSVERRTNAVHMFEVYTPQGERPQVGEDYDELELRVNGTPELPVDYGSPDVQFTSLVITTPEEPDNVYFIYLYIDWSLNTPSAPIAGSYIPLTNITGAAAMEEPLVVSFGPVVAYTD